MTISRRSLILTLLVSVSCMINALPCVYLQYDTLATASFFPGHICLVQDSDTISLPMEIRHRGLSSLSYDKPSYAIKILDSIGEKQDTSLLGMRNDNYWILDAMAADKARMRNRVSMDLWLEFSHQPWYHNLEPKMINGYRGQMVEVLVNGSKYGIYHLCERVDRKQLKLKKYSEKKGVEGCLYKGVANYKTVYYNLWNTPSNTSATWDGWEQKYPNSEDDEPISWNALYHHIYALTHSNGNSFADTARLHMDLPVFIDYILFTQLLSARDNRGKNIYISFYNAKSPRALYTPWDLDHSWGRQYNGNLEESTAEVYWAESVLYQQMQTYYHLQDTLAARYAELRASYFTIEHIDSLFAPYFDLYISTGMDTLEQQLWSGHNAIDLNIPSEQTYIHNWTVARLAHLDTLYHYTPPVLPTTLTTIPFDQESSLPVKIMNNGQLVIRRDQQIYDMLGRSYRVPAVPSKILNLNY